MVSKVRQNYRASVNARSLSLTRLFFAFKVIQLIESGANPDQICKAVGLCSGKCLLFPPNKENHMAETMANKLHAVSSKYKVADSIWDWIIQHLEKPFKEHLPLIDLDGDKFSTHETLRGSNWRGRDCNDLSSNVYPGRKVPVDNTVDWNCNGIHGRDPATNKLYKDELCGNSGQLGVAVLGGSACSHFSIRAKWVDWVNVSSHTYNDLVSGLENEIDWPHRSWATGYDTTDPLGGPVDSVYLRMRSRNLCNHRDYQNIGVNGDSSNDVVDTVFTLARNQTTDHPMLVFYSPLGDDICNMDPQDPLEHMTTVPVFKQNVITALQSLDKIVPAGSHVVFFGLVNGSLLWDTLHDRLHPFGVTYRQLYAWLSCLHSNPCTPWLNSNGTIRDAATQRAYDLSAQYQWIVDNVQFKNFDLAFYPTPVDQIMSDWIKKGGDPSELIEPVDGFHPSQTLNALIGKWLFDNISKDHPNFLGPINPNNAKIQQLFGDQGGY